MFEVGDYIVYGGIGVCKVDSIGKIDIQGVSKDKLYYTLVPIYIKGRKIYIATDNEKALIRPLISKKEALQFIDEINTLEVISGKDEKSNEEIYKKTVLKCDFKECLRIIKTLYLKKRIRIEQGKRMTNGDEKYLHMAEENLYGELSVLLEMNRSEVSRFIESRVDLQDSAAI